MKAIILFSGGVDSTVMLALALERGVECYPLSFDYNQRHKVELAAAAKICRHYRIPHQLITIDSKTFRHSSLVNEGEAPKNRTPQQISSEGIPNTYVPARNTIFLAYALGQAEIIGADEIHFGMNALDRHCYIDCRPEYLQAFQGLVNMATKQSVLGSPPKVVAPLAEMDKVAIMRLAVKLNVPLSLTHSCYTPLADGTPCSACDACILRAEASRLA